MFYASFIHNFRFISCNHIIMMLIVYASILTLHFTVGADWSRVKQTKQSKSSKKTKMRLKSQLTGSQTYSASVTRKAESTNHIIIFYWFKYVIISSETLVDTFILLRLVLRKKFQTLRLLTCSFVLIFITTTAVAYIGSWLNY